MERRPGILDAEKGQLEAFQEAKRYQHPSREQRGKGIRRYDVHGTYFAGNKNAGSGLTHGYA